MNDELALMRAICASPGEDTPRLMIADYYAEHGQPERAEFIATQIALANLPPAPKLVTPRHVEFLRPEKFFPHSWDYSDAEEVIRRARVIVDLPLYPTNRGDAFDMDIGGGRTLTGGRICDVTLTPSTYYYGRLISHVELIVEFGPWDAYPHRAERKRLEDREQELFRSHGGEWTAPVAAAFGFPMTKSKSGDKNYDYFGYESGTAGELWVGWEFRRGFVGELKLRGDTFLQCADKLLWHPNATDKCPECGGSGELATSHEFTCYECKGSGLRARPFPPTAQPVTRVTITSECGLPFKHVRGGEWACRDYPGVTFMLPNDGTTTTEIP